jgi:predicted regulator of Ras-like GTPase activity (Roadblock/LC7/MglB family)
MATSNNSFLLPKALQTCIEQIIYAANLSQAGIRAVLLSTTEGVPLGRVVAEPNDAETLHPDLLQMMESVLAPASKQVPVLGKGKLKQVTAFYDHGIVVHQYQGPVVGARLSGCRTFDFKYSDCERRFRHSHLHNNRFFRLLFD